MFYPVTECFLTGSGEGRAGKQGKQVSQMILFWNIFTRLEEMDDEIKGESIFQYISSGWCATCTP